MLFNRSTCLFVLSCVVFSVTNVNALPAQHQQQQPLLSTKKDAAAISTVESAFLLTESLSEYYESIIDQVMLDVSEDVLTTLPKMLSQGDVEARQLAEKSLNRNLNFMRASLLASIHPLISTDLPQIDGFSTVQDKAVKYLTANEDDDNNKMMISAKEHKKLESTLTQSILTLNKKVSHQLGLIVNAERSSSILIRQAILHNSNNHSNKDGKNKVVTVEWHLRKPFQINIVHEEEEDNKKQVTTTTNVATETKWLNHELSTVEKNLLNEFDDRVEEAVQLVMETLALDL